VIEMKHKTKLTSLDRRSFLKVGIGAVAASPFIHTGRRAAAASRGSAVACIRFWLSGGARSSAMWDADHLPKYNPYGKLYTTLPSGVDYFVGGLWNPSLQQVLDKISVVRSVYHGDKIGTNHRACSQRSLTGGIETALPGWSVVINRELRPTIPSIVVGSGRGFSQALGNLGLSFSSIVVPDSVAIARIRDTLNAGFGADEFERISDLRNKLSLGVIRRTAAEEVRDLPFQQTLSKEVVSHFSSEGHLDLRATGDSEALGRLRKNLINPVNGRQLETEGSLLANEDLRTLFEVGVSGSAGRYGRYNEGAMLALRLVQSGSKSVTISSGGWDTHQGEANKLGDMLPRLGSAIAGLIQVLDSLQPIDPSKPGNSALDQVLLVVDSEFSRDNTDASGYNGDDGSDHQSRY